MASLETQLKTLVHVLFKKSPKGVYRRNPLRDWQKIIVGSFIFTIALLAVDGYFFYKINKGELFAGSATEDQALPTLDHSTLKQLNATYDRKEQNLQTLQSATEVPIDPSL